MSRLIVGPFNRVEGDLEVQLELDAAGARVREARVVSPMYRGFENLLLGRDPLDALVIVPRICGICSVSQSVAAALALADAAGVTPPANGRHALNLMLACENAADHLSHFYLFFLPDFTRPVYADRPWHAEALRRFAAQAGERGRAALAARQRWFTLMGTLGGKWPHTHSIVPGGSSRAIDAAERLRLLGWVREFRGFAEQQLFGAPLEQVAALATEDALAAWADAAPGQGDLRQFLAVSADLGLDTLGRGPGLTLSVGAYRQFGGAFAFAGVDAGPGVGSGFDLAELGKERDVTAAIIRRHRDADRHRLVRQDGDGLRPHHHLRAPTRPAPGGVLRRGAVRPARHPRVAVGCRCPGDDPRRDVVDPDERSGELERLRSVVGRRAHPVEPTRTSARLLSFRPRRPRRSHPDRATRSLAPA